VTLRLIALIAVMIGTSMSPIVAAEEPRLPLVDARRDARSGHYFFAVVPGPDDHGRILERLQLELGEEPTNVRSPKGWQPKVSRSGIWGSAAR
jgi:hypothetical protein